MSVPRVTFDELYRRSSQYRLWSYTREELQAKREAVNNKGCLKVDERLKQLNGEVSEDLITKVTVEEELKLISFNSRRIGMLAKHLNLPSQVRATAVSFLRKFYLVNSVMEYHPKLVLLTCLFLAAKSENSFISINSFSKRIPKTTPESILKLEFEVLQSLKFTLFVHHPFRPLYGFFYDLQDVLGDEFTIEELGRVYDKARKLIDEALISDAVFHFTPPQIALACFKSIKPELVDRYLEKKFKKESKSKVKVAEAIKEEQDEGEVQDQDQDPAKASANTEAKPKKIDLYQELSRTVEECTAMIRTTQNPTKEEATDIDRKVHYCISPSLVLKRKREDTSEPSGDDTKRQRTETPATPM
ncbi:hypothetical protein WICPIJ_002093 [Wickerhamomyces pijperi]|uniref:Cyclin-like domain-containing protein n=1 Tax=Wickerhamomyces pijperi TaxID=599730 RepID=A0A9P8QAD5_WICPI|nr:hypothetical protein WICPIJ_002093 [Wickerhamomyces pijperi]